MPWIEVVWTDENEQHLAANAVSSAEAEHVLRNAIDRDVSRTTGRPIAFGYTPAGRKLAVVYEEIDPITIYPITAYEVD